MMTTIRRYAFAFNFWVVLSLPPVYANLCLNQGGYEDGEPQSCFCYATAFNPETQYCEGSDDRLIDEFVKADAFLLPAAYALLGPRPPARGGAGLDVMWARGLEAISQIRRDRRVDFVDMCGRLVQNMSPLNQRRLTRVDLISAAVSIGPQHWLEFEALGRRLIFSRYSDLNLFDDIPYVEVYQALTRVLPTHWVEFEALSERILLPRVDGEDTDFPFGATLEVIAQVPRSGWRAFEDHTLRVFATFPECQTFAFSRRDVLSTFALSPRRHWGVLEMTYGWILRNLNEQDRIVLFDIMSEVPGDELLRRMNRVMADFIPEGFPERGDDEERLRRMIEVLETPLAEAVPPRRAGMAGIAAAGGREVDVHAAGRDQATRHAVLLLLAHQPDQTSAQIQAAYDRFSAYFESLPETGVKANARLALHNDRGTRGFGGLLQANHLLSIRDLSGTVFLGRLWLYIEGLGAERELARASIIGALSRSIERRRVVCDPGKIQRLVVDVLQGRLLGVDVDGLAALEAVVQLLPSMENLTSVSLLFFTETRQAMDGVQLRAEVPTFLAAQPGLVEHRAAFFESLMADIEMNYDESDPAVAPPPAKRARREK